MKQFLITLFFIYFSQLLYAQENRGLCGVEVSDVSKVSSFGYLVSYVVQFKNTAKKTVDGVYFNAYFYDNSNKLIKSEESSFNSDNVIDPIASGFTKAVARAPRIKGASKVVVVINKIHYSDGSSCK
jgi:hypothetical protein